MKAPLLASLGVSPVASLVVIGMCVGLGVLAYVGVPAPALAAVGGNTTSSESFDGCIDDCRVSDIVRSATYYRNMYQKGVGLPAN